MVLISAGCVWYAIALRVSKCLYIHKKVMLMLKKVTTCCSIYGWYPMYSKLYLTIVIIMVVALQSCFNTGTSSSNGACDAGRETVSYTVVTDSTLTILQGSIRQPGNVAYYSNTGNGIAMYYIYYSQENICTKEHLNVKFESVVPPSVTDKPQLKVYGEVYYHLLYKPYTTSLFEGELLVPRTLFSDVSVGLKQVYENKPGLVEIFLTVEFPSKGSPSENEAFFRKHISSMKIQYSYDKHK